MSPAHRRYLRLEMAVAAMVNAGISIAFALLVFGGRLTVAPAELVRDAAPQSFFVALFTVLVPGLLTRRRLRAGAIAPLASRSRLPRALPVRAGLVAVVAAALGLAAHALLLPRLGPASWSFPALLAWKTVYGALLGSLVARLTLPAALAPGNARP